MRGRSDMVFTLLLLAGPMAPAIPQHNPVLRSAAQSNRAALTKHVSAQAPNSRCGHHARLGSRDAEVKATLPADFLAIDSQRLLKTVLRQTKGAHMFSGYHPDPGSDLDASEWKWPQVSDMRPIWWRHIFDEAHMVLDCGNKGASREGKHENFACHRLGAAPFHTLDNFTNEGTVQCLQSCNAISANSCADGQRTST